jgi:hypothetical protein
MKASLYRRIDAIGDAAAGLIDRILSDNERFLKGFCWGVIFVAALYFAPVIINILTR